MLNNMLNYIKPFVNGFDFVDSKPLVIGMLLSDPYKSCISMAKPLGISHDVIQKIYDSAPTSIIELKKFLINLTKDYSDKNNRGWLIIDDTTIAKPFAKILEGLGFVYDTSD